MARYFMRFVSIITCLLCVSGCSFPWTTENADPYTPNEVKTQIEGKFSTVKPQLVLQDSSVEKEKPFQANLYTYYDENNGFSVTVKSYVTKPHFIADAPLPGAQRKTNGDFQYADAYLQHLNGRIADVAGQYGYRVATTEEAQNLYRSELKRRAGTADVPLYDEGTFIFVGNDAKGSDMVKVLKDIYALYKPNDDDALLSSHLGAKVTFYYLPQDEMDWSKAAYIMGFYYHARYDWKQVLEQSDSKQDRDAAALEAERSETFENMIKSARRESRCDKKM